MTNIGFLTYIHAVIYKSEKNNKYYVQIPFITYNNDLSYITNFSNSIFILITKDLLNNNDLEDFIKLLDNRYEYYYDYELLENNIAPLNNIITPINFYKFIN